VIQHVGVLTNLSVILSHYIGTVNIFVEDLINYTDIFISAYDILMHLVDISTHLVDILPRVIFLPLCVGT
jgi:hypothetical protein